MIAQVNDENTSALLRQATSLLEGGGIVAYPTETFYGLGVHYERIDALKRLYEIKQRPPEKVFPLIIGDEQQLSMLGAVMNDAARMLIRKYWPGPLTIIFKTTAVLNEYIASDSKVAVRIPGESFALKLAHAAGFPLTSTSANSSGLSPADSAPMVYEYFKDALDLIIDAGKVKGGLPSTIVDVSEGQMKILRKGALDLSAF